MRGTEHSVPPLQLSRFSSLSTLQLQKVFFPTGTACSPKLALHVHRRAGRECGKPSYADRRKRGIRAKNKSPQRWKGSGRSVNTRREEKEQRITMQSSIANPPAARRQGGERRVPAVGKISRGRPTDSVAAISQAANRNRAILKLHA